jgi:S1-C subfamily serine protease
MVKGADDGVLRRLQWRLHDQNPKEFPPPPFLDKTLPRVLCPSSGSFRGWQKIVNPYLSSVKYVQVLRKDDVEAGASAYVIAPNILVTAGHVAERQELRIGFEKDGLVPSKVFHCNKALSQDWGLLYFEGAPFETDRRFEFRYRLPEIGEEVVAIGYPRIPNRQPSVVVHSGTVEALPVGYHGDVFIQTSFQSGGGLSGGPLIDKRGFVLGLMIENVYMQHDEGVPAKGYGQATPHEYLARARSLVSYGKIKSREVDRLAI